MSNHFPIPSPPPALVQQWLCSDDYLWGPLEFTTNRLQSVATKAARWGANQELEACICWLVLNGYGEAAGRLRAARRPPPPSLKERIAAAITAGDERTALSLLDEALPE